MFDVYTTVAVRLRKNVSYTLKIETFAPLLRVACQLLEALPPDLHRSSALVAAGDSHPRRLFGPPALLNFYRRNVT